MTRKVQRKVKKKLLFIYNANAGKGKIRNKLSLVIEKLCRADYEVTIYATAAPREATKMVIEEGKNYDVIVCSGGDGTINEVVTGLMYLEDRPVCGYLPAGTVNDFASSLKIPKTPEKALDIILQGNIYNCDIGSFDERYFNYIAAFGAFTEVAYETPQNVKNALGKTAYFLDALKRIPQLRGYQMRVEYDNKVLEGEYIYGMVCNSKSVGGFPLEGKKYHMKLDDGLFEVVMVRMPNNAMELERTINALLSRSIDNPYIDAVRAKHIHIVGEDTVQWTLDGENGGSYKEVDICCNKRALRIFSSKKNHK